jgi:hypothetical protein
VAIQLNYSSLDRILHRMAFAGRSVQLAAADMEEALFGSSYRAARGDRPIFITSLPRAGTTLLLEVLHRFPSLASHTYRDMPFVLAPVIWSRLISSSRQPQELKERAHGDGMQVGYDSPEAFEEILWRTFWPEKYTQTRISLWDTCDGKPEARAFFVDHMKKVIALRRPDRLHDGRYISKNNANVARLDFLTQMFPDARILVPVRRPVEQARSLLHQHFRFLQMHREHPFVRRYMADIGHYEFGDLHRPIDFAGLEQLIGDRDPCTLDYWLAYWIAAFEHVLRCRDKTIVVSYEASCLDASRALSEICARLDIADEGTLSQAAGLFRSEPSSRDGRVEVDLELLERAEHVHEALVNMPS